MANSVQRGCISTPATSVQISPMPLLFSAQHKTPRAGNRLLKSVENQERAHSGSVNPCSIPASRHRHHFLHPRTPRQQYFVTCHGVGAMGFSARQAGSKPVPSPQGYHTSSFRRPSCSAGSGRVVSYLNIVAIFKKAQRGTPGWLSC